MAPDTLPRSPCRVGGGRGPGAGVPSERRLVAQRVELGDDAAGGVVGVADLEVAQAKLADGLDIEVTDLYLAAGYQPGHGLPGLAPYLRAKYDLPPEAIRQLEDHFELINDRYVREQKGGHHGQDHQRAA